MRNWVPGGYDYTATESMEMESLIFEKLLQNFSMVFYTTRVEFSTYAHTHSISSALVIVALFFNISNIGK